MLGPVDGMPQVRLELLRPGPPHNQLLSPLVTYLALCGDQPVTALHVPFEHRELVEHLRPMRYETDASTRSQSLQRMQEMVGSIFRGVPGLSSALNDHADRCVHLRCIVSPRELAMIPFELAQADDLVGGTGPLVTNTTRPVCLTREVRAASSVSICWPTRPRVLLVTSDAGGDVPADDHRKLIVRALGPWIGPGTAGEATESPPSDADVPLAWSEFLTVLRNPTLEGIRGAVAKAARRDRPFTHVHILAHGGDVKRGVERRYGLVLHDADKGRSVIPGDRLAVALSGSPGGAPCPMPAVVTVASCDGANEGGPLEPGAGLAHELHVAGISFVVASQYPLSKAGSVVLTGELYRGLFRGTDPRRALVDARNRLYVEVSDYHDWASVVAYARLPADIDDQIQGAMVKACAAWSSSANAWGWAALEASDDAAECDAADRLDAEARRRLERAIARAELLRSKLDGLAEGGFEAQVRERRVEIGRILGATHKRVAERESVRKKACGDTSAALHAAYEAYRRAHDLDLGEHWSGSQAAALGWVLGKPSAEVACRWWMAYHGAVNDLHHPSKERRSWALSDLVELALVQEAGKPMARTKGVAHLDGKALLDDMVALLGPGDLLVRTTVFQLRRYLVGPDDGGVFGSFLAMASKDYVSERARTWLDHLDTHGVSPT